MDALRIFIEGLIGLGLVGSVIPLIREQTWWLRAWTYGRLQVLAVSTIVTLFYIAVFPLADFRSQIVVLSMLIIATLCLRDILPFTPLFPKQSRRALPAEPGLQVSLFVANVLMDNDNAEGLLRQIEREDPDIIFLVETDKLWMEKLSELEVKYPYNLMLPQPDYNGMLLYSRYLLKDANVRYLVQEHIPSITTDVILSNKVRFKLYGVHPRPPRPQDDTSDLDDELLFIANEVGYCATPVIVTGDLNDVGWSSTTRQFLRQSGLCDPRRGRGLYNSYSAKSPFIRWPLDHVFHSKEFSLLDMRRLEKFGSDHFPIFIRFNLRDQ